MSLILKQETAPSSPASGKATLYVDGSNQLNIKDSGGTTSTVVTAGGSSPISTTGNVTGGNLITAGNAVVGGIKTDNYYYANGSPLDMQQPAGSNTQIQYNNNNDFGASSNFTFNSSTNQLGVTGTLSVSGNANVGNLGATGVFATTLSATGNANVGNIGGTRGVFTNVVGTLETASQPNITSVGILKIGRAHV